MTIANCPRCCEQVTVPESASREATVRCPLCQEEYSLAEALAQLPPTLIVVSDIGQTHVPAIADEDDADWSAMDLDDDDNDEVALAPVGGASALAPFDFASGSATTGAKATASIRSNNRSRKPKSNPIKSVLSIVIGGLMAFPIAQLILWYLPGDLKRDFGAGPIVAQYVPAIVPAKFRGSQANVESNSETSLQDSNVAGSGFNFGESDKFATSPDNFGQNENANNAPANNRNKKSKANTELLVNEAASEDETMSLDDAATAGADVFGAPLEVPGLELGGLPVLDEPRQPAPPEASPVETVDAPALDLPALGELPPAIQALKPEVAGLAAGDVRNAPQVTADQVVTSFQAALSGNLAWDTDESSSPSGPIKREFYQSFSKLGEALTFADPSDEKVATQIEETGKLLHSLSSQPDKLKVIGDVANGWIAAGYETRQTNGVCLHGVVKSVESIGNLFETTVESGGRQIAVVSKTDPAEYFAAGRQVLVLGTIVDDPAKNLGGYEGSRKVVVLDGYHVNVPVVE